MRPPPVRPKRRWTQRPEGQFVAFPVSAIFCYFPGIWAKAMSRLSRSHEDAGLKSRMTQLVT